MESSRTLLSFYCPKSPALAIIQINNFGGIKLKITNFDDEDYIYELINKEIEEVKIKKKIKQNKRKMQQQIEKEKLSKENIKDD